jgi:SAM-dependent methyltransferase
MKKWPPRAYNWYRKACEVYDYPAAPYGKAIKGIIETGDTVLDLGCGIGAASLMIAPFCKRVLALDPDEKALEVLAERARGTENIEVRNESWPPKKLIRSDVIVALHVAQAMRSLSNLRLVYESARKGGFIACNSAISREKEPFVALKEELGIRPNHEKCGNGCYIKGAFEAFGASVKCKKIIYDFGQPLDSIGDAVSFLAWQIGADLADFSSVAETIKKHADSSVPKTGGRFLVPLKRQSCGITFLK